MKEGTNLRFRCHTGHAFSVETLLAGFQEQTEETLWNAIRAIEETVLLMRRMAEKVKGHQHEEAARSILQRADTAQQQANLVREAVMHRPKGDEAAAAKTAGKT